MAGWAEQQGSLIRVQPALAMVWLPEQQTKLCALAHSALGEPQWGPSYRLFDLLNIYPVIGTLVSPRHLEKVLGVVWAKVGFWF